MKRLLATLLIIGLNSSVFALECGGSFNSWLKSFKSYAKSQRVSQETINEALSNVHYLPSVIRRDRRQHQFSITFNKFAKRVISAYRLKKGRQFLKKHKALFRDIERRYGVPGAVIVAFWGLESDFGKNMGKDDTLSSLATLAHDCRRSEEFQKELLSALKIVDRGDLNPNEMRGSWAGEIGQTQFLPSYYIKYGVDFDRDGKRDLIHSSADALASTANYLKQLGWKRGEPWIKEVVVPKSMPWGKSGIRQSYSLSYWGSLGIRDRRGRIVHGNIKASLLLPMGKDGTAFLVFDNFKNTYLTWNNSLLYSLTAGYFATRLAGAPVMLKPRARINSLNSNQVKTLQKILASRGYDVGKIDGIIGEKTREAVQKVQAKLGMSADGYPTLRLLQRLK